MSDLTLPQRLRQRAIRHSDILAREAADELDRLNADVATLRSEVRGLHETSNTLHKDRDRLNAQALELCAEISGLRREREDFHMDYRMKCDEQTKRLHVDNERLRGLLREARDCVAAVHSHECDICGEVISRIDAARAGAADQPTDAAP